MGSSVRGVGASFWCLVAAPSSAQHRRHCLRCRISDTLRGPRSVQEALPMKNPAQLWLVLLLPGWLPAQEHTSLKGHRDCITSLAFSPDGRTLASASYDGTVKLWEVLTGQERVTLRGHQDRVFSVA